MQIFDRLMYLIHSAQMPEQLKAIFLTCTYWLQICVYWVQISTQWVQKEIEYFIRIVNFLNDVYLGGVAWLLSLAQVPEELFLIVLIITVAVLAIFVVTATTMGIITWLIGRKKHRPGGFWWGFVLGVVGIIVVACRPAQKKRDTTDLSGDNPPARPDAVELMEADSKMWFCPGCGRAHPSAEDSCLCGVRRK